MAIKPLLIKLGVLGGKKAKDDIKGVDGSITSLGKSALKVGASFFAAQGIINGIKQSIQLGAQIEGVRAGFENLAQSSGFSADLFEKLNSATDGTVDSMELMQQANNAMLLGIADSDEQMAEMFDTAQRLASALGQDTAFGVESLVTGLGRQSKLMLDNLGIMVDTEKANQVFAKSIGKTVTQLTDQEKKQAFVNAALESGKKLVEGLGDEQLTTRDKILQAQNAFTGLLTTLGERLTPVTTVVLEKFKIITDAVNKFLENIDFVKTFENIKNNTSAFITAYQKQWRALFDLIPDLFKKAMSKFVSDGVPFFQDFLRIVKEVALVAFEPLVVAISHVGQRVKKGFTDIINGLIKGLNFFIDKTNALNPFKDIPRVSLLDKVEVDPLLEKLKETKIGQFVTPTGDDIQTVADYVETTQNIWAEYYQTIKGVKDESDQAEIESHNKKEDAKLKRSVETIKQITKEDLKRMKSEVAAGKGLADKLFAFQKQKRDQKLNEEIQAVLKSKMTEEQKESAIANLKEQFRLKDVAAKKKMKHINIIEAMMNTAVAVTEALPNTILAALTAAAGAAEVATIRAQEFNAGGIVPGVGNRDTVPALLTPGEVILNQAQQENLVSGMGNVTVNIGGNIIGEESFVRDTLIPEIERARTLA